MKFDLKSSNWWGPPKKFSTDFEDRKVSWLELFYDLVYVIAIAKITHHLSEDLSLNNLFVFVYFFVMIFWGWLNGSLYHDLHGTTGIRTRLMTLWQILIVAALVIVIDFSRADAVFNITIVLMIMQVYITYLWWSVGIYDKYHRKLNRPYTVFYLLSFALLFASLYVEPQYLWMVFYTTLVLNYLPPFVSVAFLGRNASAFTLSSSMSERMGLFTIIIFGEVMSGVITGVGHLEELNTMVWVYFTLAVFIVFGLWWLFFTLISDVRCKSGYLKSSMLELLYIPTLLALGLMGMAFSGLFASYGQAPGEWLSFNVIFGFSLALFLLGIATMMRLLNYPKQVGPAIFKVQLTLFSVAIAVLLLTFVQLHLSLFAYLSLLLTLLLVLNFIVNYYRHSLEVKQ
ncbi:MAG: low temperature requirement protein A [Cyclobacteriaceae bacterium]|nr:low temperature requirement protein A [Cyclobacteriaceae bacterium]